MNKKSIINALRILLFFMAFPITAFSQKQIHLQGVENGEPVEYANIYIGDVVFYTDKGGNLEILDSVSAIKVSYVCYADTLVLLPKSSETIVLMTPKQYELPSRKTAQCQYRDDYLGINILNRT